MCSPSNCQASLYAKVRVYVRPLWLPRSDGEVKHSSSRNLDDVPGSLLNIQFLSIADVDLAYGQSVGK